MGLTGFNKGRRLHADKIRSKRFKKLENIKKQEERELEIRSNKKNENKNKDILIILSFLSEICKQNKDAFEGKRRGRRKVKK